MAQPERTAPSFQSDKYERLHSATPMSSKLFRKEEVEGKTVIYSSGWVAGKVKDVIFGLDGSLMLVVAREDGAESKVPMSTVMGVGDYVVVRDQTGSTTAVGPSTGAATAITNCKFCGHSIPPGTVYCPNCDRSQV